MKILLALLFAAVSISAAVLRSTVVDLTTAVVVDAPVRLTLADNSSREIRTNSQGQFTFENVPSGDVQLTIDMSGFKKRVLKVHVQEPETIVPAIILDLTPPFPNGCGGGGEVAPWLSSHAGATALNGRVVDETGAYPPTGTATLTRGRSVVARTSTTRDGSFKFDNVEPAVYLLRVEVPDRTDFVIPKLTLVPGLRTTIDPPLPILRCPKGIRCYPTTTVTTVAICL